MYPSSNLGRVSRLAKTQSTLLFTGWILRAPASVRDSVGTHFWVTSFSDAWIDNWKGVSKDSTQLVDLSFFFYSDPFSTSRRGPWL